MPVVFAVQLLADGSPTRRGQYARLPPPVDSSPYKLRFVIPAGCPAACNAVLVTNYPASGHFQRDKYQRIRFQHGILSDAVCEFPVTLAGVFEYYVEYTSHGDSEPRGVVTDLLLPLDGICILTLIPKWMPTISRWPEFFKTVAEGGYNMVHMAPLAISPELFDSHSMSESQREKVLKDMLSFIKDDHGRYMIENYESDDFAALGYNLKTAPHLRPAYELDEAIMQMSDDLDIEGVKNDISSEKELEAVMSIFKSKVLPGLKLWEYYVIDVKSTKASFKSAWQKLSEKIEKLPGAIGQSLRERALTLRKVALTSSGFGSRFSRSLNPETAVQFMKALVEAGAVPSGNLDAIAAKFVAIANEVNLDFYKESDADLAAIYENIYNRAKYLRVDENGPKLGPVSRQDPFVDTYFTRLPRNETTVALHDDELPLANNGWIWNGDPLLNFAGPQSKAYLRREVIAWGDCVKLRYGEKPAAYTEKMARIFHGFRIDNCHSTPINVASYLLDVARRVNPNLYVFAELFTGSEEKDILFVKKLGINSLIREAMNAWDPHELSRLVHRHGGIPVGSLTIPPEYFPLDMLGHPLDSSFYTPVKSDEDVIVNVVGSSPHALFMDCTHDNETPHQKRTAEDTLSTAALVAMSHYLHIIESAGLRVEVPSEDGHRRASVYEDYTDGEELLHVTPTAAYKPYPFSPHDAEAIAKARDARAHIKGRKTLGAIAGLPSSLDFSTVLTTLATVVKEGKSDASTDMQTVIKVNPGEFRQGSIVLFRTWMVGSDLDLDQPAVSPPSRDLSPVFFAPKPISALLAPTLTIPAVPISRTSSPDLRPRLVRRNSQPINNVDSGVGFEDEGHLERLWRLLGLSNRNMGIQIMVQMGRDILDVAGRFFSDNRQSWPPGLGGAVDALKDEDINVVLYRAGAEEYDTIGENVYDVPGFGSLAYCGLQGFLSAFIPISRSNDLGHSMCGNLRDGPWMLDYITGRLKKYAKEFPRLNLIQIWMEDRFEIIKVLPNSFIPKYFFQTVFIVYHAIRHVALARTAAVSSKLLQDRSKSLRLSSLSVLTDSLYMVTYQLHGRVASTGLYPAKSKNNNLSSLAAGLPHFATQHMRCWGRDIFISLRGLFLIPGSFDAAREHILAFGANLRHGLIPNLLDQSHFPRYNARDAAWWWLWGVQQYCKMSPEGLAFLKVKVARRFPPIPRYRPEAYLVASGDERTGGDEYVSPDDSRSGAVRSTVAQLCHEILERHARGEKFREWNAGPALDHAMTDAGFDISYWGGVGDGVDGLPDARLAASGLVGGGNSANCGTWMDKMGDSEKAGTKGRPATPRDGAAVEIVGLAKAALRWVVEVLDSNDNSGDVWPSPHVVVKDQTDDTAHYLPNTRLVNKRGIYKDTVGSSQAFSDYQLRPNFCVALVVAPELFDPDHARAALEMVKKYLAGPLGMRTLDPEDWAYRGDYDNANDSTDGAVAHGFNYHQGPEWLWLTGYYLRAYLLFNSGTTTQERTAAIHTVQTALQPHKQLTADATANPFAGLPELTNRDGAPCRDSCPTQAWSAATLVEVVADLVDAAP
ncbi:hypothetical protein HK405_005002 [Cladochytrium tenue]|nr:hypothetical protein HK405_005002 [Cladochytrium tenue]